MIEARVTFTATTSSEQSTTCRNGEPNKEVSNY